MNHPCDSDVKTVPDVRSYFKDDVIPTVAKQRSNFHTLQSTWPPTTYFPPEHYVDTLVELTTTGRGARSVEYFMARALGLPPEAVEEARESPMWTALVLGSAASPAWLQDAATAATQALPNARHRSLAGGWHDVPPETLAPALTLFH